MSLSRVLAVAFAGVSLTLSACAPSGGNPQGGGNTGGSGAGGDQGGGDESDTGGSSGSDETGGTNGGTGGKTSGSGGAKGGTGGSSGSTGGATSSTGGTTSGTGGATSGAGGSTSGAAGSTGGSSTTACPGTPIVVDWTNGWMDAAKNPVIHGAWYVYGDTNGSTFTPAKATKVTTNCLTGTIAAAGWGGGFGFNVNQAAGSEAKAVWATPPKKICFEVELTGAAGFIEMPMSTVDQHAPPYGQVLASGVNMVDLALVKPTWAEAGKSPGTWNPADVAEIHLKVAKPGTDFKLCVKGITVQ